jgi:hypothetical protein
MVKKLTRRTRLVFGVAIGAGLMFLFDPERGTERRTRLREQIRPSRAAREDEVGTDVRPRPVSGVSTPAAGSSFEVESTITPRPLAG